MYSDKLREYFDDLASRKPAPGGGSAAGLVGAAGVSLLSMVANFTLGKDRYRDVESEIKEILNICEKYRLELEKLIDEDVLAYQKVTAAYSLSKETEEEKKIRAGAIQEALVKALKVPLEIARACFEASKLCKALLDKGNVNLVSDVGVAAEFLASGYKAALLNVEINLSQIKDSLLVSEVREEIERKQKKIEAIRADIAKYTLEIIKK
ncbi:MAG: cyclodeaminase/cyclohydrolase family protein [Candidatus Omnitrophica bacterium]|nr:cyclodeaminase/cyclohydrolase family protein [Candidatus Omnitrophota bacterium]